VKISCRLRRIYQQQALNFFQRDITLVFSSGNNCNMSDQQPGNDNDDTLLLEQTRPKLKKPPLFKVVLLNDDYTPMEFVVHVLEAIFGHDRENATRIMLSVHKTGKGICGIYTRDIAETKVTAVNSYARENKHPLLCDLEEN